LNKLLKMLLSIMLTIGVALIGFWKRVAVTTAEVQYRLASRGPSAWKAVVNSQFGFFNIAGIVTVAVGVTVVGAIVVALWPTIIGTNTSIQALTQTDVGTKTMQSLWPIVLIGVGVGVSAGLILYILHKMGLMDEE
jgi:hypothetical protein